MKVCPNCQTKYPDDANFCPQETCATPEGPRRLEIISEAPSAGAALRAGGAAGRQPERRGLARPRHADGRDRRLQAGHARGPDLDPAVVERSQRELKQLQRAQSPRLAKILDFGKEPDGRLFVVSELVDGQTLDAGRRRRPGRSRSTAPRRSSPRSARRCSRGRRSASFTTTWPPRTCWSAPATRSS